tara:strand:- start:103 stop:348 length:246 start_codon:yes stop_codon:yes gene_type:complete
LEESFWLIDSNSSRVKRFHKNKNNKDKFFDYMFVDTGKIFGILGNEPPVMQKREELKIEKAREEWKKLLDQGWLITKEVWL